jgi:predicted aspartyl protease
MGRFTMKVDLANSDDLVRARAGHIPEEDVRRVEIEAWADRGATRLVLPQWAVDQLGVPVVGKTKATLADHSTIERDVVRYVWLKLLGREGVFTAIVEPNRTDGMLGAIVLEDLDMIPDCVTGTCYPRDPKQIITVIE